MRLTVVNCIVLACIATSFTKGTDRSKRSFPFLWNLIPSQFFGTGATTRDLTPILGTPSVLVGKQENFKLYRIPGFDNILVRAVPKVKTNVTNEGTVTATTPPSELEKEREPNVAILENYLGTKTLNDTVKALQGVRDMLKSGVLVAQKEAAQENPKGTVFVIPPMTSGTTFQPKAISPPKVPATSFLTHMAPMSVNRYQDMISMPLHPLPIQSYLPSVTSYLVPRPMNPVDIVDMPFQPFVNTPPIFVAPSNVAVKGFPYPYKPCCKSTVMIPAKRTFVIEEKVPVMRPPVLVKNTVVLSSREPAVISPVASTSGNDSGQPSSYKVVNNDGSMTTFSKFGDNDEYNGNMDSDEGYYQTDDGRIFYSRLVKDPSLEMSKEFQDEVAKRHRMNQYTVTNVEEFKKMLNHDDVKVTYGTDKDNDPFLSYRVPPSDYSFLQVQNVSTIKEDNFPPPKPIAPLPIPDGIELPPSGPSKYSFKQIHQDGSITEYIAYENSSNQEVEVLQTAQDFKDTKGKGQIPFPGVMFEEPFVYEQINLNDSQPAVSQVEDTSTRFDDRGDDQDKVNAHEHVKLEGGQNGDAELHSVPLSILPTMPPTVGLSTVPKNYNYAPLKDDLPFLSAGEVENQRMRNYPFKIIDSGYTFKSNEPSQSSSNANDYSFSNINPIVVPAENEEEDGSSFRGDVPGAFS